MVQWLVGRLVRCWGDVIALFGSLDMCLAGCLPGRLSVLLSGDLRFIFDREMLLGSVLD